MQKRRRLGRDDAGDAEREQRGVERHRADERAVQPLDQTLAQLAQVHDALEVGSRQDDVGDFLGDGRALAHRDSHIGLRKGRGVVHAVAHHGDHVAFGFELIEIGELVFGKHVGLEFVDAGLRRDALRRLLGVAGKHDDLLEAERAQHMQGGLHIVLQRILEPQDADERAVDRQIERLSLIHI